MTMFGPITRISMSLALLTLSILLTGDLFFGKRSEAFEIKMEVRSKICEALAIQFSSLVASNNLSTIGESLSNVVQRDSDILSAALRRKDGKILAEAGNHDFQWEEVSGDRSTLTHTQVPIFKNNSRWGTVEVRFTEPEQMDTWQSYFTPFVLLTLYMFIAGFIGYVFFMRRTLKHLDPSAVIPDRVRAALDVLTEGVVLVDDKEQVVLANASMIEKIGLGIDDLIGRPLASLGWLMPGDSDKPSGEFPWKQAMKNGKSFVGTSLRLNDGQSERKFMVNSSPIYNDASEVQGALATFDDVTELEEKNLQLSELVSKLEASREEVNRKNKALQILAERDSLTDVYNRRAFRELTENAVTRCADEAKEIAVIMVDIDFFKKINDSHGHGVGDEVIKAVAATLREEVGSKGVVGRYGGEEFCLSLPFVNMLDAYDVGERLREAIPVAVAKNVPELDAQVTASLGVSCSSSGASNTDELLDQADVALYASKESGRNKVTRWDTI